MRRRSSLFPMFVLAVCAVAVWTYFSPYRAMNDLRAAAEAGDAEAMNELVDFPALRESIKQGVSTAVSRQLDDTSNPLARLGGWFAGKLASPLVDTFVSPDGIAALTRGSRPGEGGRQAASGDEAKADGESWKDDVKVDREYEGVDRFVVHFIDRESNRERVALVWHRDGLAGWKLTGVRLPADPGAKDER
jgi:hypothetical protein